jgi:hypothetical protein
MITKFKRIIKNQLKKIIPYRYVELYLNYKPAFLLKKNSYSQCGEDLIVEFILNEICQKDIINYCDIGANLPWKFSNTAKFYFSNNKRNIGVLVEPDPSLAKFLKLKRSKDIIVNKGVKSNKIDTDILDFFIMDTKTLNTFSESEANYYESLGYKIKERKQIDVIDINELLKKYFSEKTLHFLSVDVEGLDFDILSSLDFNMFKPICICVETINFVKSGMAEKDFRIEKLLTSHGYFEYAFTGINSIFLDLEIWNNR